jgi:hypothetical protein
MQEARKHTRVAFRLPLDLYCGADTRARRCRSRDIGLGGVFAYGVCALREDAEIRVVLDPDSHTGLHMNARVRRVSANGVACEFVDNSPPSVEVLKALLTPTWDGENLLDGVARFAPWDRADDLAGWMRLTSMVSDWGRLVRLGRHAEGVDQ